MKHLKSFADYNSMVNEAAVFSGLKDMEANWKTKLKKPANIHAENVRNWDFYETLQNKKIKNKPGFVIKIQTPFYKYGIITDKSWFTGDSSYWEIYLLDYYIDENAYIFRRKEKGGNRYTDLLFVRNRGVYALGGNGYNRDIEVVPDEYKNQVKVFYDENLSKY